MVAPALPALGPSRCFAGFFGCYSLVCFLVLGSAAGATASLAPGADGLAAPRCLGAVAMGGAAGCGLAEKRLRTFCVRARGRRPCLLPTRLGPLHVLGWERSWARAWQLAVAASSRSTPAASPPWLTAAREVLACVAEGGPGLPGERDDRRTAVSPPARRVAQGPE